ncbi:FMN-dependent alpha-hydroxy acid dehydrogenase [Cellulomonas flavigena DSM 20109]|uniref:FMN-dependent alpha-hydroxy acid dehydrogenase n=1 Tax=Cellulomonas flavigena (strain ATCC 482 / DSM 20109 / BCRC 11376 / JCM 18109 / NBRC 3775 / NCIMB 8073 / NRS 134) TaxID=446466 RepID=D5UG02_CELFN|nr:alpha-hydroxy acid oxidase [Cellulomonas flavigena]ADG75025.1 FMN-dependent alpha-hydroxy acid dehydrogenase [Cellulomonas flavigena DSM 20109]
MSRAREAERRARDVLDPVHFDFLAGGAGAERTLADNEAAFARRRLLPRVLRGAGAPDLSTTLLGAELAAPVVVAPTAFHRLAHPDGEVATAVGVAAAGGLMTLSMMATVAVEHVADVGVPLWFGLYLQPDRGFTAAVVARAQDAGCRALVVTADSPVRGRHTRDLAHGFRALPEGMVCENMRDADWRVRDLVVDADLTWDDVAWLRATTSLPVLVKGVLHPADARLAVGHGVDGVIVSNHGGRQLDGAVSTLDALPGVVDAVAGRVPVLLDGGVRSGTDALVALALGADAVMVGRPVLWGLALGGAAGVRAVLGDLADELAHALTLVGARRPGDLTPDLVVTP